MEEGRGRSAHNKQNGTLIYEHERASSYKP